MHISGSNGGWGAPVPIRQWKFRSPLLGPVTLEEFEGETANYLNAMVTPDPYNQKIILPGYPNAGYVFNFSCPFSLFITEQAKRVIQSVKIRN